MKIFSVVLLICSVLILCGCEKPSNVSCVILKTNLEDDIESKICVPGEHHRLQLDTENVLDFRIIEIEGCEYIASRTFQGYLTLTHKGNCKNPFHNKVQ